MTDKKKNTNELRFERESKALQKNIDKRKAQLEKRKALEKSKTDNE